MTSACLCHQYTQIRLVAGQSTGWRLYVGRCWCHRHMNDPTDQPEQSVRKVTQSSYCVDKLASLCSARAVLILNPAVQFAQRRYAWPCAFMPVYGGPHVVAHKCQPFSKQAHTTPTTQPHHTTFLTPHRKVGTCGPPH